MKPFMGRFCPTFRHRLSFPEVEVLLGSRAGRKLREFKPTPVEARVLKQPGCEVSPEP